MRLILACAIAIGTLMGAVYWVLAYDERCPPAKPGITHGGGYKLQGC